MKITPIQKMIALVAVFVIVAAAGFLIFIVPQFGELGTLALQKDAAEVQLKQAKARLDLLSGAKSRSAATEAELLRIATQMPDSPQLPTLIVEMQDIANDAGVSVTSFAPGQPAPAGGQFTEIPVSLQVTTTWDDLLDYLRRLNRTTRLLRVTSLSITPDAAEETTGTVAATDQQLTVSLSAKAYVIGTNGKLGPAGSTAATTTP